MTSNEKEAFPPDSSSQEEASSNNQQSITRNTTEIVTVLFDTPIPISRFPAGGLTMADMTFSLILKENYSGFRRGDELSCIYTDNPMPGTVAILERDDCVRWSIFFDEARPEIANGAKVIGQVISLHRNLLPIEV